MTEQFIYHEQDGEVEDALTGEFYEVDKYRFDIGIVRKMNELSRENEQLKQQSNSVYEIVKEYVMSHHCISTMRMLKKIEKVMCNE